MSGVHFRPTTAIRELQRFLLAARSDDADHQSSQREKLRRILDGTLTKAERRGIRSPTAYLWRSLPRLTIATGVEGILQVLHGDVAGWDKVYLSWMTDACRVACGFLNNDPTVTQFLWSPSDTAAVLAPAIALGERAYANWLTDQFGTTFAAERRTDPMYRGWTETPYYAFVLALAASWRAGAVVGESSLPLPLGPYADLFRAWHQPERLVEVLSRMCDEHVWEAWAVNGWHLRFPGMILNYFPVEILAVAQVRHSQGLPMPVANHSFLKTPLYELPARLVAARDPLIEEILELLCQHIPGLLSCGLRLTRG